MICPHCGETLALSDADAVTVGRFHQSGPGTDRQAAWATMPKTGTQRRAALDAFIGTYPEGLTDWELGRRLGVLHTTAGPRRYELREGGWIVDSGQRRIATENVAVVWKLSTLALERLGWADPEPGQLALLPS